MYEFCEREQCYYTRFGKIDCVTMEMNDEKLEKLFIKAKQTNNGEKNLAITIINIFYIYSNARLEHK